MATGLSGDGHRQMRRLFAPGTVGGLTDAQLLERFATRRDEAAEVAFEALVARHGPMVFRACRALLRDPRDAEDAFQATFLVLARKADRVGAGGPLGPWLHGVARKVALKARAASARRGRREGGLVADPPTDSDAAPCPDLVPTLHEELGRLPEKYRRPVVLCHLEGLTHAEAAAELGWPVGTVSVRLARARDLLRQRLSRRGLTPDASMLGPALLAGATPSAHTLIRLASAALPPAGAAMVGAITYGKGSTFMKLSSLARWLAIPLALGVGAAGGVAATRWSLARPATTPIPPVPGDEEIKKIQEQIAQNEKKLKEMETPQVAEDAPDQPIDLGPIPDGFFDLPVPDPEDGPVPEPVKPGQTLVIEVLEALPGRPITGERVVRPDGTISLGFYGDLRVAGLDRNQIKVRLIEQLREHLVDEVLGLVRIDAATGKPEWVKPVDSSRVFVDDSWLDRQPDSKKTLQKLDGLLDRVEALERELKGLRESRSGPAASPE